VKGPPIIEVGSSAAVCGLIVSASGKAWPVRVWCPSLGRSAVFSPILSNFPSIKDDYFSPFFFKFSIFFIFLFFFDWIVAWPRTSSSPSLRFLVRYFFFLLYFSVSAPSQSAGRLGLVICVYLSSQFSEINVCSRLWFA
jgi:hypothetical protein